MRRVGAADDDDVTQPAARVCWNRFDARQQLGADHEDARTRVANHVLIVGRLPERVQRHRHRARFDRAEEAVRELGSVEEQQQHTFFRPHAETAQRAAEAVHLVEELLVRDPAIAALDGDAASPSDDDVAVDEVRGDVESVWDSERFGGDAAHGPQVREGCKITSPPRGTRRTGGSNLSKTRSFSASPVSSVVESLILQCALSTWALVLGQGRCPFVTGRYNTKRWRASFRSRRCSRDSQSLSG